MDLKLKGRLIAVLDEQSGTTAKGTWKKQEFVIETVEQFPKKVCMSLWGDKTENLKSFAIGEEIIASINLESREYNGRWYTEARAWRLEKDNGQQVSENRNDENFTQSGQNTPIIDSTPAVDDLPF